MDDLASKCKSPFLKPVGNKWKTMAKAKAHPLVESVGGFIPI